MVVQQPSGLLVQFVEDAETADPGKLWPGGPGSGEQCPILTFLPIRIQPTRPGGFEWTWDEAGTMGFSRSEL